MFDREQEIIDIARRMRAHHITWDEVAKALETALPTPAGTSKYDTKNLASQVFAWLGAIFIFGGIGVYIHSFWPEMSSFMRVFVTLGVGLFLSALCIVAMKEGKYPKIILPLVLIAACVETGGWFVLIHEIFPQGDDTSAAAMAAFGIMTLQQVIVFHRFRRAILLFTVLAAAYCFMAATLDKAGMREENIALLLGACLIYTSYIVSRSPFAILRDIGFVCGAFWFSWGFFQYAERQFDWKWASMATGLSLCAFSLGLKKYVENKKLAGAGLLLGSALFYNGLFEKTQHTSFELLYLAVSVAMLFGSALLASRALLLTSVIALLGFIGYFTEEHFVHSIGWPIALIIMGVAFFAVSAAAMKIKRRYRF